MTQRRPVLSPAGSLALATRDRSCAELLHHCGADLGRVLENHFATLDRFLQHMGRMPLVRHGREAFLSVVPGPDALYAARLRGMVELALPGLSSALWLICVSPQEANEFVRSATEQGDLDDDLHRAPIWTSQRGARFLVLSAYVHDPKDVPGRVRELSLLQRSTRTSLSRYVDETCPTAPTIGPEEITLTRM